MFIYNEGTFWTTFESLKPGTEPIRAFFAADFGPAQVGKMGVGQLT